MFIFISIYSTRNVISIWFRKLIQYLDHHLSKNVYRMILISSWHSLYILTLCALLPNWNDFLFYCVCNVNILAADFYFWHGCFLLRIEKIIVEVLENSLSFSLVIFYSSGISNFQSNKKMKRTDEWDVINKATWYGDFILFYSDSTWGVHLTSSLFFFFILVRVKYLLSKLSCRGIFFVFLLFLEPNIFLKLIEKLRFSLVLSLFSCWLLGILLLKKKHLI